MQPLSPKWICPGREMIDTSFCLPAQYERQQSISQHSGKEERVE